MAYSIEDISPIVDDVLALAEEVADSALPQRTDLSGLSAMFLARAYQALISVRVLASQGLNGDAMSVGRTVIEMSIDYRYIARDPAVRIKKFSDYDDIAKFRIAQASHRLNEGGLKPETMRILEQRHDTARLNNPESDFNWAGASIKKRAIEVDALAVYELPYADMCNASHSCYGTLEYALVGLNEFPQIHFGPMKPDARAIDLTAAGMLMLINHTIDTCKLPEKLAEKLNGIRDRLKALSAAHPKS